MTIVGAGEAVITATVEDSDDYSYSSKTAKYNLGIYGGTGAMPVAYAKAVIDASNIQSYIGEEVVYSAEADTEAVGTYRVFFYDTAGKYDDEGTLFIKRDYMEGTTYNATDNAVSSSNYSISDFLQFNTEYPQTTTSLSQVNDTQAAYLCTKANWTNYKNSDAEYAIGSPSIEMFMDSYNQWKGTIALDYEYVVSGTTLSKGIANVNGYAVAPGVEKTAITDFGPYGPDNSIDAGPTGRTIYMYGSDTYYWLASPSTGTYCVSIANGRNSNVYGGYNGTIGICPVVSLGN